PLMTHRYLQKKSTASFSSTLNGGTRKLTPCPVISSQNTLASIQTKLGALLHLEHFGLLLSSREFLQRHDLASHSNDLSIQTLRFQQILVIGQFGAGSLLHYKSDVQVVASLQYLEHLLRGIHSKHQRMTVYLPDSSLQKSSHYYRLMEMALVRLSQELLRLLHPYTRLRQILVKLHLHIQKLVRRLSQYILLLMLPLTWKPSLCLHQEIGNQQ